MISAKKKPSADTQNVQESQTGVFLTCVTVGRPDQQHLNTHTLISIKIKTHENSQRVCVCVSPVLECVCSPGVEEKTATALCGGQRSVYLLAPPSGRPK